jgi:hypothetical protein
MKCLGRVEFQKNSLLSVRPNSREQDQPPLAAGKCGLAARRFFRVEGLDLRLRCFGEAFLMDSEGAASLSLQFLLAQILPKLFVSDAAAQSSRGDRNRCQLS